MRILLLKERTDDDRYAEDFGAAGFAVTFFAPLRFIPRNHERLADALRASDLYGGLIVTSPRAAERVSAAMRDVAGALASWGRKRVYAVGPRTVEMLRGFGLRPDGQEATTGAALARRILSVHRDARPLLLPCGTRRRDELPAALRAGGVECTEIPVYETRLRSVEPLHEWTAPEWVAFFSPSGVEAAGSFVSEQWPATRRAAIGPTTAAALVEAGIPPHVTASRPASIDLVRAVRDYAE